MRGWYLVSPTLQMSSSGFMVVQLVLSDNVSVCIFGSSIFYWYTWKKIQTARQTAICRDSQRGHGPPSCDPSWTIPNHGFLGGKGVERATKYWVYGTTDKRPVIPMKEIWSMSCILLSTVQNACFKRRYSMFSSSFPWSSCRCFDRRLFRRVLHTRHKSCRMYYKCCFVIHSHDPTTLRWPLTSHGN
jgi:hypothetical protein